MYRKTRGEETKCIEMKRKKYACDVCELEQDAFAVFLWRASRLHAAGFLNLPQHRSEHLSCEEKRKGEPCEERKGELRVSCV